MTEIESKHARNQRGILSQREKTTRPGIELLATAARYPMDWNYGNAVHNGNMILGRIALHKGGVASARHYLLESGRTPGSPQLGSFEPNVSLAKELIEIKELDTVLQYFSVCKSFWKMGDQTGPQSFAMAEWPISVRTFPIEPMSM